MRQRVKMHSFTFNFDDFKGILFDLNSNVKLDVFDFDMTHIVQLHSPILYTHTGEGEFVWNGRDKFRNQVQNGVYFLRLNLSGKIYWTKLMVINT